MYLIPAATLFFAFFIVPAGYAAYLSLRASTVAGGGIGVRQERFVGLRNYREVATEPEFFSGIVRMLTYSVIVVPIMLGLALFYALLLDSPLPRGRRLARLSIFLPYAVPTVIASLLWGFLYLPVTSPLTDLLEAMHLSAPHLLEGRLVYGSVANIAIWGGVGFNMIVMFTSLRATPAELLDAARIDGCSELQLALRVKIPLLVPSLVMTGVFSTMATLQVYNEPATLRPLTDSISSTWMPMMKIYRDAFIVGDYYLAATASLLFGSMLLLASLAALQMLQKRAFGEEH